MSTDLKQISDAWAAAEAVLFDIVADALDDSERGRIGLPPANIELPPYEWADHLWHVAIDNRSGDGKPYLHRHKEHCAFQMSAEWVGYYLDRAEGQQAAFRLLASLPIHAKDGKQGIINLQPDLPTCRAVAMTVRLSDDKDGDRAEAGTVTVHEITLPMTITFQPQEYMA